MATPLPAPLKNADITRFAIRAKELEKFKPVIAYWCMFYEKDVRCHTDT
jgi:vacuolar protein sorting-associated protein VTA1